MSDPTADRSLVPTAIEADDVRLETSRPPVVRRVLGVTAAAVLGIGTFALLGMALAGLAYDRGWIGRKGSDGFDGLAVYGIGIVTGAVVGVVVAVWVGMRVWRNRWAVLLILSGVSAVTIATIVVTSS
jgi:hypothetical protein